ncbi:MAG: hypothetical protein ACK57K_01385 [Chryseotalea sp.]|jgi:hypothetical protein
MLPKTEIINNRIAIYIRHSVGELKKGELFKKTHCKDLYQVTILHADKRLAHCTNTVSKEKVLIYYQTPVYKLTFI